MSQSTGYPIAQVTANYMRKASADIDLGENYVHHAALRTNDGSYCCTGSNMGIQRFTKASRLLGTENGRWDGFCTAEALLKHFKAIEPVITSQLTSSCRS